MAIRVKMTAKQDLLNRKIKKGDVITFIWKNPCGSKPSVGDIAEAVGNYVGASKSQMEHPGAHFSVASQYYQWDIKLERI